MNWSKQLCSVLILSLIFIMTSIHSTSSVIKEYDNSSDQVMIMDSILDLKHFFQSSVNETTAYGPPVTLFLPWGWAGNISYTYWDVTEDKGIPGANVSCYVGGFSLDFYDMDNGLYYVELNTTNLWADMSYYLTVNFDKTGFENQVVVTPIFVHPVHTHLEVFSPEVNQLSGHPLELVVPLGDSIEIMFSYNDTEGSDAGGLEGAQTNARIIGPTLVEHYMEIVDEGNGNYSLTFDTTIDWLYESVGGTPTSHELSYLIYVEFNLENRVPWELLLNITIIDIPTEFQITPTVENIVNDGQLSIFVSLVDIWPTHGGLQVQGLNITVESSDPILLEVVSVTEDSPEPGVYNITLYHRVPASVDGGCTGILYAFVDLTINLEKEGYEGVNEVVSIGLWSHTGLPVPQTPIYGLPISIIIVIVVGVIVYRKRKSEDVSVLPEANR
ncbi:MAG: hypothetical protein ACXACG_14485 [Candidatus Thorarchaeota archaeon]